MKKVFFTVVILLFLTVAVSAQQLPLQEVIGRSARGVEESLTQGTMVAVLNFSSPSETFSDYVIEELTGELVMGKKLAIVDRQNLDLIRDEMNLQMSGDVSDQSAQAIGKLLGAQAIVSGTLTNMGTYHRFRIRVISVETGRIQTQVSLDLQNDRQVAFLLGGGSASATATKETKPKIEQIANSRNNWLSLEPAFYGAGPGVLISFERMLGQKISLGINGHFFHNVGWPFNTYDQTFETSERCTGFGVDIPFRFYPTGKIFYFETAVGFIWCRKGFTYNVENSEYDSTGVFGLTISPGVGCKIDVGKAGGFYIQPGISGIVFLGDLRELDTGNFEGDFGFLTIFPRVYFGAGIAF